MAERGRPDGPDFFVSYGQADLGWAEWIAWQLESAGYSTMLHAWDLAPGTDWVGHMQRVTASAMRTIAVLSSAYLESNRSEAEWHAAFARDPTGEQGLLLPVRVEAVELSGLLASRDPLDLVGLTRQAAKARLLEGVAPPDRPRHEPPFPGVRGLATGQEPRFPGLGAEITNLPPRNRNFVGRADVLERLQRGLRTGSGTVRTKAKAIYGLGGVGKTQVALEYAHWHAAEYQVVWWIPAYETTSAVDSLATLARQLGIPERADQRQTVAELFAELRRRDGWLLIYDDAQAADQLQSLLPAGGDGHVLITSRNPAWRRVADPIPLGVMRRRESVTFLGRRTGSSDREAAAAVANLLGDLPLALEDAAAYVEETDIGLGGYLRLVEEHADAVPHLPAIDPWQVAAVWSVSLDQVAAESRGGMALLELCAFLATDDIPRELPVEHPDRLPSTLAQAIRDPLIYHRAVRSLSRYSLVTATPTTLGVHPLVQVIVRSRLGPTGERHWAEAAVRLLRDSYPDQSRKAAWRTCQRLLPHVLAATRHAERLGVAADEAGWLLDRAEAYLRVRRGTVGHG